MKLLKVIAPALLMLALAAPAAFADSVLVRDGTNEGGQGGYGDANWSILTGLLDAATGNQVTVAADFTNNAQVQSFDALWVNTGSYDPFPSTNLNAAEIANIQQCLDAGKCVVLFGENTSWTRWNTNILSVVGGSQAGGAGGNLNTVFAHALTAGVNTINVPAGASASVGGTSLFSQNVATLWGGSLNALTFLDSNTLQNGFINNADNLQFGRNLTDWIASSHGDPVPEPGSFALLGLGLVGFVVARHRRRAA